MDDDSYNDWASEFMSDAPSWMPILFIVMGASALITLIAFCVVLWHWRTLRQAPQDQPQREGH